MNTVAEQPSDGNEGNPVKRIEPTRTIIRLFLLLLIASLAFVFWNMNSATKKNIISPIITKTQDYTLSNSFPDFLPLNSLERIIESYSASYPNQTAKQSTVVYTSSATPQTNYDFYLHWAAKNSWKVINNLNSADTKSIYLRNSKQDINISINQASVTITYVQY